MGSVKRKNHGREKQMGVNWGEQKEGLLGCGPLCAAAATAEAGTFLNMQILGLISNFLN